METVKTCSKHGNVPHGLHRDKKSPEGRWRCKYCQKDYTLAHKRKIKVALVNAAGGKCQRCGYNRYIGALEFHHRERASKERELSSIRSLTKALEEIKKCDLFCSNCHKEVEAAIASGTYIRMKI